jgi:hypothetical protein
MLEKSAQEWIQQLERAQQAALAAAGDGLTYEEDVARAGIRQAAAAAAHEARIELARHPGPEVVTALSRLLETFPDRHLRTLTALDLGRREGEGAAVVMALLKAARDADLDVRRGAILSLGKLGERGEVGTAEQRHACLQTIRAHLAADARTREIAQYALRCWGEPAAVERPAGRGLRLAPARASNGRDGCR